MRPEGEPGGPTADPVLARGRRPGCRSTGPESGGRLGPRRHHCDRATLSGSSCPRCPVCKRRASAAQGSPVRTERLGCLQPLEQTGAASALTAVTVVSRGPREHRHAEPCASWGPDPPGENPTPFLTHACQPKGRLRCAGSPDPCRAHRGSRGRRGAVGWRRARPAPPSGAVDRRRVRGPGAGGGCGRRGARGVLVTGRSAGFLGSGRAGRIRA